MVLIKDTSHNQYNLKSISECYNLLLKENPLLLESKMQKDDGLFYILYTSNLLLETVYSLKPNQVSAFGFILEQNQLLKLKKNIKPLSNYKFGRAQKIIGKGPRYDNNLYSSIFMEKTNNAAEMFVDSETIFFNYDKNNNTNCLGEIRFIFTNNEKYNYRNIATAGAAVASFAATILSAVGTMFDVPELNQLMSGMSSVDYANPNTAIGATILSIFGNYAARMRARNNRTTIIDSICTTLSNNNKENLIFEPVYYPIIEKDISKFIKTLNPVSKEFVVRIIAYEKER